ncbi:MAG: hypothetical protein KJZ53_03515 [Anaerolineales bacterium]|nr:hypothetical protein [Anaerolineales bacterium]
MQELSHFQAIATHMIAADRQRDHMLRAMDAMWHNRWQLPPALHAVGWVHKVVSTDPHDAVRAGTRVLSSVAPRITAQPRGYAQGGAQAARQQAERIERALAWHFRNASRRRRASVLRDVVLSALLYDEVVAQVVYLPAQQQAARQLGLDASGLASGPAQRFGPFAIIVRNPQHVHVRYSDWAPEAVLLKQVMPISEAAAFWGSALTEKLPRPRRGRAAKRAEELRYCTIFDYMDTEQRAVWAVLQEDGAVLAEPTGSEQAAAIEIVREEHGLGFLPWAAKVGGTTLHSGGAQRIPLLASVFQSGQWDTQNIVETLLASEVIAYAAAPRLKVEGPTAEVDVDYGEPGRVVHVPPGHQLNPLAAPGLDESLARIAERVAERMGKSTVPRVLQTADFPNGTAFATLNLATQSGIKSLTPYKELAEDALAEVFQLMLSWVQHSGQALDAYVSQRGRSQPIRLDPSEADLTEVLIDVELTADVPTDRMARINAASMAVRDLGYSRERALEQIGETDAKEVMAEAEREQLAAARLEARKRQLLAGAVPEPAHGSTQGLDPAAGGLPPVVANPEAVAGASTRE